MQHFPAVLGREQSDALAQWIEIHLAHEGFGPWAVAVAGEVRFIGFVGLNWVPFEAHFTPAVELGWRLARAHWGKGYATEAAQAALGELEKFAASRPTCLLCFCRDPAVCHRRVIAERLQPRGFTAEDLFA